jgi:hypothetical protein
MESTVEQALAALLAVGEPIDYARVKAIAKPEDKAVPVLSVPEPDLSAYDLLLTAGGEP